MVGTLKSRDGGCMVCSDPMLQRRIHIAHEEEQLHRCSTGGRGSSLPAVSTCTSLVR